jgi:hypothetical protein
MVYLLCLSMIFSENRLPLFGIMHLACWMRSACNAYGQMSYGPGLRLSNIFHVQSDVSNAPSNASRLN